MQDAVTDVGRIAANRAYDKVLTKFWKVCANVSSLKANLIYVTVF